MKAQHNAKAAGKVRARLNARVTVSENLCSEVFMNQAPFSYFVPACYLRKARVRSRYIMAFFPNEDQTFSRPCHEFLFQLRP